jgi:hypothetical protein
VLRALWLRRLPAVVNGGFDWVDVRDRVGTALMPTREALHALRCFPTVDGAKGEAGTGSSATSNDRDTQRSLCVLQRNRPTRRPSWPASHGSSRMTFGSFVRAMNRSR